MEKTSNLRCGIGYDVHAFCDGRPLILGGVRIAYDRGLLGHSDADVLSHAIADSLLSASRLGDIGSLFPDTDPAWEGADSLMILGRVADALTRGNFEVIDVDSVIIAQDPKLSPYRDRMRQNIAGALGIGVDRVGIKATTTEKLGYEGRGEGISAVATCLVLKRD